MPEGAPSPYSGGEYLRYKLEKRATIDDINKLAKDGWEVEQVVDVKTRAQSVSSLTVLLKRTESE